MKSLIIILLNSLIAYLSYYILWPTKPSTFKIEDIFLWYLPLLIITFITTSITIGGLVRFIKNEEYGLEEGVIGSLYKGVLNTPSIMLAGFFGGIFSSTVFLAPIYSLTMASIMISEYKGFDALSEAIKQFLKKKKYFTIGVPDTFLATILLILFLLVSPLLLEYLEAKTCIGIGVILYWIMISRATIRISREYIYYGLKICIYCENEVPIEAAYCNNCGHKLK